VLANAALVFTDPDVPEAVLAMAARRLPPPSGPKPAAASKQAHTDIDAADKDPARTLDVAARAASGDSPLLSCGPRWPRTSAPRLGDPAEVAKTLAAEARTGVDVGPAGGGRSAVGGRGESPR